MRIVLDSNVLVSAMLSPHGPPAQVLRLALQGDLVVLYDDRLLAEYSDVLSRPKFGFEPNDVSDLVDGLQWSGAIVFARPLDLVLPDPDDLAFLEVAVAAQADALVTGNRRHFIPLSGAHGITTLAPHELLDVLAREHPSI